MADLMVTTSWLKIMKGIHFIMKINKQGIKRNDIILIIIFLLVAALFLAGYFLFFHQDGTSVQITVNGEIYKTLPLDKDTAVTITGYNNGKNTLQVRDGYAFITDADCPDKLCQKQKKIRYKGETLVCLPNKVVISVISGEKPGIDGMAY